MNKNFSPRQLEDLIDTFPKLQYVMRASQRPHEPPEPQWSIDISARIVKREVHFTLSWAELAVFKERRSEEDTRKGYRLVERIKVVLCYYDNATTNQSDVRIVRTPAQWKSAPTIRLQTSWPLRFSRSVARSGYHSRSTKLQFLITLECRSEK